MYGLNVVDAIEQRINELEYRAEENTQNEA